MVTDPYGYTPISVQHQVEEQLEALSKPAPKQPECAAPIWANTPDGGKQLWHSNTRGHLHGWTRIKGGSSYHPGSAQVCTNGHMWNKDVSPGCEWGSCPEGYVTNVDDFANTGPHYGDPSRWPNDCPCKLGQPKKCHRFEEADWQSTPNGGKEIWHSDSRAGKHGWSRVVGGSSYHPGSAQPCTKGHMWRADVSPGCQWATCPAGTVTNTDVLADVSLIKSMPSYEDPSKWPEHCPCLSE